MMQESILDKLEALVTEKKKLANSMYETELIKKISNADYDNFLSMIKMIKDSEKEQSRLDWKAGYIQAFLDLGDAFCLTKEEAYPKEDEIADIEIKSFEFVKKKFN